MEGNTYLYIMYIDLAFIVILPIIDLKTVIFVQQ